MIPTLSEEEWIKFSMWITGHDRKTIEQLVNDWNAFKTNANGTEKHH